MTQVADIVVQVCAERYDLDEFRLDKVPKRLFEWEYGGAWDPVGQLFNWLWGEIQSAISWVETNVMDRLWRVRDYLWDNLKPVITAVTNTLRPLLNTVKNNVGAINNIVNGISGAVSDFAYGVGNAFSQVGSTLGGITNVLGQVYSSIGGVVGAIGTQLSTVASTLSSSISSVGTSISSALSSGLSTMGSSFSSGLSSVGSGLGSAIASVGSGIAGGFTQVYGYLSSFGQSVFDGILDLKAWMLTGLQTLAITIVNLGQAVSNISIDFPDWVKDVYGWVTGGFADFGTKLTGWYSDVNVFFTDGYNKIAGGVNDVIRNLTGMITPLIDIKFAFKKIVDSFVNFISDPLGTFKKLAEFLLAPLIGIWDSFKEFTKPITTFLQDPLKGLGDLFSPILDPLTKLREGFDKMVEGIGNFLKKPTDLLKGAYKWAKDDLIPDIVSTIKSIGTTVGTQAKGLWDTFYSGLETTWDTVSKIMGKIIPNIMFRIGGESLVKKGMMKTVFGNLLGKYFFEPLMFLPMNLAKLMIGLVFPPKGETVKKPGAVMTAMGGMLFAAMALPYAVSNFMMFIGDNLKFTFGFKPLGVGGNVKVDVGSIMKHLGKMVWRIPDVLIGSLAYGFGIWISQPVAKVLNAYARNEIPIEMPDIQEIRVMANRSSVSETFKDKVADDLRKFMAYYGWSDGMIEWNLGYQTKNIYGALEDPPKYLETTIKDRFKDEIKIPLALRFNVPTGSELSRMMVRDVILEFPMFEKIMRLQGFAKDISKLYYLLHYRYPTPDHLWNFYRRGMAGMLWYKKANIDFPEQRAKLFSEDILSPASPETFNMKESVFKDMIERYMKWHDYAPFCWRKGWPSDRHIILDLMADIPMRIDARWLYKWSIIPDGKLDASEVMSVFNVVRARGVHPKWEESITVSECMNAMQEERSYVRTGVLNALERGFATKEMTHKKLNKLTTIELLGKERTVRFLDGEQKLLVIRSMYDRGLMVLNKLWGHLLMGFQRNLWPQETVMDSITKNIPKLGKLLNIDLKVDTEYLNIWVETFTVRHEMETIQRMRYWMRVFIYRATQLAESGEEYEGLIDEYVTLTRLTPVEATLMKDLGGAFIRVARRRKSLGITQKMVKGKVRSGTWSIEEGIKELMKAGMDEDDAKAYLEADVKTRIVSIDKLISMAEKIPISPELLKKKMDAEGVPLDEQKLYIPFAIASEISSEQNKVVTELISDYVNGMFSEADLKTKIDAVATLDGKVQNMLGVAWVNYSPQERGILIDLANKRRTRKIAPSTKIKTVSSDKLISLMENVPVSLQKLKLKMTSENIPLDEQSLYMSNAIASEVNEEIGKIATELVTDFANGMYTEAQLITHLDNVATLGGAVPQIMNIPWIVLSPIERSLLVNLAKFKLSRRLWKEAQKPPQTSP